MAVDPIDSLRLSLLQDVLPVSMAMVERVRQGGASKVVEAFTSADEPLEVLRLEGEPAAKAFRDRLDKVSPGLGNPVVPVDVAVEVETSNSNETLDQECLMECLDRIQFEMQELESFFVEDSCDQSPSIHESR